MFGGFSLNNFFKAQPFMIIGTLPDIFEGIGKAGGNARDLDLIAHISRRNSPHLDHSALDGIEYLFGRDQ